MNEFLQVSVVCEYVLYYISLCLLLVVVVKSGGGTGGGWCGSG